MSIKTGRGWGVLGKEVDGAPRPAESSLSCPPLVLQPGSCSQATPWRCGSTSLHHPPYYRLTRPYYRLTRPYYRLTRPCWSTADSEKTPFSLSKGFALNLAQGNIIGFCLLLRLQETLCWQIFLFPRHGKFPKCSLVYTGAGHSPLPLNQGRGERRGGSTCVIPTMCP